MAICAARRCEGSCASDFPADNPADLLYGTFLGGSGGDYVYGISAVNHAFLTGSTSSSDFPTTVGAVDTSYNGSGDAYVVKLNPTGSYPTLATFIGGSGGDVGSAIAVDDFGSAYLVGYTSSSNFPTTSGAFDTSYNGGTCDAFVVKLSPPGNALAYATYLGGEAADYGESITLDTAGSAYVTGYTNSSSFPTTSDAFRSWNSGGYDVFAVELRPPVDALAYATYLGGVVNDYGVSIALDTAGSAYLTGSTYSSNFPTTPGAFDTSISGKLLQDAFAVKLNPAGAR